ncbi:MAG: endonuclease/exonuclease/phosphatase family protein [Phocaeicola sp.]
MRKFYSKLLIVAFALLTVVCSCTTSTPTYSVLSFNIRYDNPDDSLNGWAYRKSHVARFVNEYAPDVVGTQEVLHNQLLNLKEALPMYTSVGVGRMDGKEAGEYAAILYKHARFDLVKSGTIGLSEQPDSIGLIGWDAACERIVTWAMLRDKKFGNELAVFNTHFDHYGAIAQKESAKLLLQKMEELAAGVPIILTGDFNVTIDSEALQLFDASGLKNAYKYAEKLEGPAWSFHNFGRIAVEERSLIDFVFVNNHFHVESCTMVEEQPEGTFLSDHLPIWAKVSLVK